MKPTPTPWTLRQDDKVKHLTIIESRNMGFAKMDISQANAAFIVKAVNLHDELVAQLNRTLTEFEAPTAGIHTGVLIARLSQYAVEARDLLKRAGGSDE